MQNTRKVGGGAAPTTLPLSTPTLYFSGLSIPYSFVDGNTFFNIRFEQPYSRNSNTQWRSTYYPYDTSRLEYTTKWTLYISCQVDDGFDVFDASIVVCENSGSGSTIPLIGWTNASWVTSGTLVISTTP